jgi:hypothetical protein
MNAPKSECVSVQDIGDGCFFKKQKGGFVFIRMSESSVRFLKLDPSKVYGVCFNGNVSVLEPETLVVPQTLEDWNNNFASERNWAKLVGIKS